MINDYQLIFNFLALHVKAFFSAGKPDEQYRSCPEIGGSDYECHEHSCGRYGLEPYQHTVHNIHV